MSRNFSSTVKGGMFEVNGVTTLTGIGGWGIRKGVARLLGTKSLMYMRELMTTLDGVVAGSAASKTLSRIEANEELGGVRTVEAETLVSRNSLAADTTEIEATINAYSTKTTFGSSPVANLDGNPLGTR